MRLRHAEVACGCVAVVMRADDAVDHEGRSERFKAFAQGKLRGDGFAVDLLEVRRIKAQFSPPLGACPPGRRVHDEAAFCLHGEFCQPVHITFNRGRSGLCLKCREGGKKWQVDAFVENQNGFQPGLGQHFLTVQLRKCVAVFHVSIPSVFRVRHRSPVMHKGIENPQAPSLSQF